MKHPVSAALVLALALTLAASAQAQGHAPRDPFARPALPVPATASAAYPQAEPAMQPQLRAILYTPGHALANINGQILAVGDRFGEYRITRIRERSVTLARRRVTSTLQLDEAGGK